MHPADGAPQARQARARPLLGGRCARAILAPAVLVVSLVVCPVAAADTNVVADPGTGSTPGRPGHGTPAEPSGTETAPVVGTPRGRPQGAGRPQSAVPPHGGAPPHAPRPPQSAAPLEGATPPQDVGPPPHAGRPEPAGLRQHVDPRPAGAVDTVPKPAGPPAQRDTGSVQAGPPHQLSPREDASPNGASAHPIEHPGELERAPAPLSEGPPGEPADAAPKAPSADYQPRDPAATQAVDVEGPAYQPASPLMLGVLPSPERAIAGLPGETPGIGDSLDAPGATPPLTHEAGAVPRAVSAFPQPPRLHGGSALRGCTVDCFTSDSTTSVRSDADQPSSPRTSGSPAPSRAPVKTPAGTASAAAAGSAGGALLGLCCALLLIAYPRWSRRLWSPDQSRRSMIVIALPERPG
jgi:hypothetical protein